MQQEVATILVFSNIYYKNNPQLIDGRSIAGTNVLFYAAKYGHVNLVRYLLEKYPKLAEEKNKYNQTIFHFLCMHDNMSTILEELRSRLDLPKENCFDKDGWHAIHYAAQGGHANIIGYLVNDCGVSIDLQQDNEYGDTAYQLACRNGHLECIKVAIIA